MSVTNNQVAHAVASFPGGVFTPIRQDGCVITNPGVGIYRVTLLPGRGSVGQNLKVTANAKAGAARIVNIDTVSQTQVDVFTYDAGGIAADADVVWVTIEVVPKVS